MTVSFTIIHNINENLLPQIKNIRCISGHGFCLSFDEISSLVIDSDSKKMTLVNPHLCSTPELEKMTDFQKMVNALGIGCEDTESES